MSMDCPRCGTTSEYGYEKLTGEDADGRPTFKEQHTCDECGCEFTDYDPYS